MQWYIEGINAHMVEDVEFIKDDRMVDVIEDVIRIRGGGLPRSGHTRSGLNYRKTHTIFKTQLRTAKISRSSVNTPITVTGIINDAIENQMESVYPEATNISLDQNNAETLELRGGAPEIIVGGFDGIVAPGEIAKRFKQCNLLYTAYRYNMHPLQWYSNTTPNYDMSGPGIGPALYWLSDETLLNVGVPNSTLNCLRPFPGLNEGAGNNFSRYGPIYCFAADWPFATMHWVVTTQNTALPNLYWEAEPQAATTDPLTPVSITDLWGVAGSNKDWQCLRHYSTTLSFEMINWAPFPMICEILFFKFIPDPSEMSYADSCLAPLSNQTDMHSYCEMSYKNFGTRQINVIKRHRCKIMGVDQMIMLPVAGGTGLSFGNVANSVRTNTATYEYKIKRKYDMMRPIKETTIQDAGLTDAGLFNNYYQLEKGVWCRVQGWPEHAVVGVLGGNTTAVYNPVILNGFDLATQPNGTGAGAGLTLFKPALQVIMKKRSYLKINAPMLKGPFKAD